MSSNSGQSLIPYPWKQRKKFIDSRRMIAPIVRVTVVLAWIATIASPPSFLLWMWAKFGYRYYNDSWSKRGLILVAVGVATSLIFTPQPLAVPLAWFDMLRSFGPDSPLEPIPSLIHAILVALPYATILQGIHALARSYEIEKSTNAFLQEQRPTLAMRLRRRRNIRVLSQGANGSRKADGYIRFGVAEKDRIPWRFSRHGMIVERRIEQIGHGVLAGATGMGKTTLASTFTHYVLRVDAAMIYLDFKADIDTMRGLYTVARDSGKPCYILDIGFGSTDTSWYDLFDWPGTPADKASVLIECFQFAEGEGGAAYYRGVAEAWLPMQIEAAEILGLAQGEGMFDFLLQTAVPDRFRNRIMPLRDSDDPALREKFERWDAESKLVKAADLQGLRNELTKITNAAGDRLKPNPDNPHPVSLREVMDNGGLVYIGIAAGVNDVVVKVLGSFIFREMSILVSARSRQDKSTLRDVFFVPDEASEMEERSVLMNPLYTIARGSRVWIWPSFQTFGSWQESTQAEIQSNARSFVAFDIPAESTANVIAGSLSNIFALKQMAQEETQQRSFQNQAIGISGDERLEIGTDQLLRPNIELTSVPKFHAYIWFKDAPVIPRGRWWGRRRVRNEDNQSADAPLVKIVPYQIALPEEVDPNIEIVSDSPRGVAGQPLEYAEDELKELNAAADAESAQARQNAPKPAAPAVQSEVTDSFIIDEHDAPEPPAQEEAPPPPEDSGPAEAPTAAAASSERDDDEPPPLPTFAVRGAHRRRAAAAANATEVSAEQHAGQAPPPATAPDAEATAQKATGETPQAPPHSIPDPWVDDDEFADDGSGQQSVADPADKQSDAISESTVDPNEKSPDADTESTGAVPGESDETAPDSVLPNEKEEVSEPKEAASARKSEPSVASDDYEDWFD